MTNECQSSKFEIKVDQFVIPAEAEPAPHLMRGIQFLMVPCLRRDGVWIPVFTGMTEKVNP